MKNTFKKITAVLSATAMLGVSIPVSAGNDFTDKKDVYSGETRISL